MNAEDFFTLTRELEQLLQSVTKLNDALLKVSLPEFMPVETAAKYLGLSASHLNKLRTYGGGPAFCDFGPKAVRYQKADLDAWATALKRSHTADKQASRQTTNAGRIAARRNFKKD